MKIIICNIIFFIIIIFNKLYPTTNYISLNRLIKEYNLIVKYNLNYNYIELYKDSNKIKVFLIIPYVVYEDNIYYFDRNVVVGDNGQIVFPEEYVNLFKNIFFKKTSTNKVVYKVQNTNISNIIKSNDNVKSKQQITKFETNKSSVNIENKKNKKFTPINAIIIDPGHGGSDPGALSEYGAKESEIVLSISKILYNMLRNEKNLKIFITRKNDKKTTLSERVEISSKISKKYNPLFISIHANISFNKNTYGVEVYSLSENASDNDALNIEIIENAGFSKSEIEKAEALFAIINDLLKDALKKESEILAKNIGNYLAKELNVPLLGIKKANFYVLKYNCVPSVLVEVGFLSNQKEAKNLINKEYQYKISRGLFTGIIKFINEYNSTEGFTK